MWVTYLILKKRVDGVKIEYSGSRVIELKNCIENYNHAGTLVKLSLTQ